MTIHKQDWPDHTRYLIIHEYGSVFLDSYPDGNAYIWSLYVFKRDRRKGIGKILLEEAEHLARQAGHKSVVMEYESKNTPHEILEWYLRCGYEVVGHYRKEQYTLEKKL